MVFDISQSCIFPGICVGSNKVSTRGSVFYQFFKSAVNGHIFEFGGSTLAHIIRNVSENSLQAAIILQELFEFVAKQFGGSDTAGKTRYFIIQLNGWML